jgi:hypothetical protein
MVDWLLIDGMDRMGSPGVEGSESGGM